MKASVHLLREANQYQATLQTGSDGHLNVQRMPYGIYTLEITEPGFAAVSQTFSIRSSLPILRQVELQISTLKQTVTVQGASTLIDPDQAGSVNQIGSSFIQNRLSSIPGRSLQDLVNSQPGWLYEGNAVLHPRGSEYQTQFVVDGIPLTDNRSPSFGPEIEADDVDSMTVYTAGYPAEYGRKLGGVVELNTRRQTDAGLHGQVVAAGGSYDSLSGYGRVQELAGKNTFGASVSGAMTSHYLNPVVPENYTNKGTIGDFAGSYGRDRLESDRLSFTVRHEL